MSWHGIKTGLSFADYRSDDITQSDTIATVKEKAISKSLICNFIADPWAWKNSPPKAQTKAMRAGSVLDCLLTEPRKFDERYAISPYKDFRTNDAKAWRQAIEDEGRSILTESDFEAAEAQLRAIKAKPEAVALLDGAQFQVAFRHPTKFPFYSKGLIDILPDDGETIVDLKTCEPSAMESKRNLRRHIYEWLYHVQAGAYCEGYSIASGEERTKFKFIFVTSKAPFIVAVVELPFAAISFGSDIYRNGAKRFAECLEHNTWPSMWHGEVELDIPEYAYLGDNEE